MNDYHSKARSANRGVTLNSLKDQLYSLNMRMLLAMQNHDEESQEDIKRQLAAVQAEINQMCVGGYLSSCQSKTGSRAHAVNNYHIKRSI